MSSITPLTLMRLASKAASRTVIKTSQRGALVRRMPVELRSFTSTSRSLKLHRENIDKNEKIEQVSPQFDKKSTARSTVSKNSLRRVAAGETGEKNSAPQADTRKVTAYCTAEKYNLPRTTSLLQSGGYVPDPLSTGLNDEVIHLRLPLPALSLSPPSSHGDLFIFPSGNIVSWAIPESTITAIAALILPSAENPHKETETENLEFVEDERKTASYIRGDVITIGTQSAILAKIAFSSGLARSTKLAVLESLLNTYLASTASIPYHLSAGSRLPFTRSFILRKTGELLSFRAQLNLYSELTDSLPDIFWDSRQELGLEGYYESVGRELDVGVRIRQLNEKLDYASEMAGVLRERLSERHGLVLEWMIIILITVEVGFEVLRLWKERQAEAKEKKEQQHTEGSFPSPPETSSDDEDLRQIAKLRARIQSRRQSQPQNSQSPSLFSATLTPEEAELRQRLQIISQNRELRREAELLERPQRRKRRGDGDKGRERPSAAAADENFEYQHRTPTRRRRGNEDEWLFNWVPYDIRSWGGWR